MRAIEIINEPKFESNAEYNNCVQGISDKIFGHRAFEYIMSGKDTLYQKISLFQNDIIGKSTRLQNATELSEKDVLPLVSIDTLGPSEKTLIHYIQAETDDTIVYVGERGSGKSSILEFVHQWLIEHNGFTENITELFQTKDSLIIKIDINSEPEGNDFKGSALESIQLQLYREFKIFLREIYNNSDLILSFTEFIQNNYLKAPWRQFADFLDEEIDSVEWNEYDSKGKRKALFNWIKRQPNRSYRYKIFRHLINYYLNIYQEKDKKRLVIFFDNVDSLNEKLQGKFLTNLLQISNETGLTVLIAMRLTTLGTIDGGSSYIFSYIEHTGQDPVSVISKRIEHYLANYKSAPYASLTEKIPAKYLEAFNQRLYIFNQTIFNSTRSRNLINSICGVSVRKALLIAQRLVVNNTVKWSNNTLSEDLLSQLFICTPENGIRISVHDEHVSNVFASSQQSNSLLKLRILDYLYQLYNSSTFCYLGRLKNHLNLFESWSDEEIYHCIRQLMSVRKKLIYAPGVNEYYDISNFIQSNHDIIRISSAGIGYYERAIYDLQYLQNCMYAINWTVNNINNNKESLHDITRVLKDVDNSGLFRLLIETMGVRNKFLLDDFIPKQIEHNVISERLSFLRKSLNLLLVEDIIQTTNYLDAKNYDDNFVLDSLLVSNIIVSITASVKKIYRSVPGLEEEIFNWTSLKNDLENWNQVLLDS